MQAGRSSLGHRCPSGSIPCGGADAQVPGHGVPGDRRSAGMFGCGPEVALISGLRNPARTPCASGWRGSPIFGTGELKSPALHFGGSVISLARMDHDILAALHAQLNRVEQAVRNQWLGAVGDVVLVPQLVGDILERLLQFLHLEWKKREI